MTSRDRMPLSSDQLELLLAFEQCDGLGSLAKAMAKDPSVVSRGLQRLAEAAPVLAKVQGRWQITPLGLEISRRTRTFAKELTGLLAGAKGVGPEKAESKPLRGAALLVINAQKGLLRSTPGSRPTEDAESNLLRLLRHWRAHGDPVFHIRHVSDNPQSAFFKDAPGAEIIPDLAPAADEAVLVKTKSSAFTDTGLLQALSGRGIHTVVVTGFTANECVDVTARQATEEGFVTYVVSDATASFDVTGPDGRLHRADRIHRLTMANLHALCATVMTTDAVLQA